ncbi:MAG: hypothetical protein KAR38_05635 [Calditrichia bacterium]|nr:hypothetical protein [Calditrichia bacterium]
MIKLKKQPKRYISLSDKMMIMEMLNDKKNFDEWDIKYNAFQNQELRNFLLGYLEQLHKKTLKDDYNIEEVKGKMEPFQKYFHGQDCVASLDACENETCLASEPNCFSKKIKGQIKVIIEDIYSIS